MFTCLEILPKKERLAERLFEKIRPPEPKKEFVQVKGATPFLRLSVRENFVDWRKISAMLSSNERRLMLPEGCRIPQGLKLKACEPVSLGMNMIFDVMRDCLEKANSPKKISVSVFDRDAFLSSRLNEIVPFVRNISVYTERVREYFYVSSRIMGESGLCVRINEYDSACLPEKIVLADRYSNLMKKSDFVFSAQSAETYFNTVTGMGIDIENEYKLLKSDLHDDFLFLSCLFEYNGAKNLRKRKFDSLFLAGRHTDTQSLANIIEKREIA